MYTLLKPLVVREELLKRKIKIFTPLEFGRIYNLAPYKTKYFLEKQTRQNLFIRLKKGLYALKTDSPSEEEIANILYQPSYISFEYALAYYNILPEMPYQITCVTTKPTRSFTVIDKTYNYYSVKQSVYTGYSLITTGNKSFLIAEKEKALTDYLYFYTLGKKPFYDRLILKKVSKQKLLYFAQFYKRQKMKRAIKKIYAHE